MSLSKTPLSGSYMDLAQKSQDTARVRHTLDSLDISLEPLGIKWFHLGPEKAPLFFAESTALRGDRQVTAEDIDPVEILHVPREHREKQTS